MPIDTSKVLGHEFHATLTGDVHPVYDVDFPSGSIRRCWENIVLTDGNENNIVIAWDDAEQCYEEFGAEYDSDIARLMLGCWNGDAPRYEKVEVLGIHEHDDYDQDDRDADANKASFTITLDGKPHVLLLHNEHNGYYYHSFAWDAETHDGIEESGESEV